ncbi:putative RNA-dependent RNA polymerase SHL2 [Leucoagaricus sp. SymC.cos]|nr:putative RNA-dependent RNA polymerase SHL2 [Leucoagaricus sp. SymC.cos]
MSTHKCSRPKATLSNQDESDYERLLKGPWWDEVDNTPEVQEALSSPQKPREPTNLSPIKANSSDYNLKQNPANRTILSKHPSAPVVSAKRVESIMSNPLFSVSRGGPVGVVPVTLTKPKVPREPPSTGGTSVVANTLRGISLTSPSKRDAKGKAPEQPLPALATKIRKTVFVEVDDDEEEEEGSSIYHLQHLQLKIILSFHDHCLVLTGTDSLPSTRPASLFEYDSSQGVPPTVTPVSSWSTTGRKGQGSWSSLEDTSGTRKRPRPSDSSEIEVVKLNSPVKTVKLSPVDDPFTTPRLAKARKESREDLPKKSMVPARSLTFPLPPDTPSSIGSFFHGNLGTGLEPVLISHCPKTQWQMDDLGLAWGVQYELARGVTLKRWTWDDVYDVLHAKPEALTGLNAKAAFKVSAVMQGRDVSRVVNVMLWEELDREQAAIRENKGRGLGLMGEWHNVENWYGGRVQQIARLSKRDNGHYHVHLEAMEKRRSHRFARYCGSRRILQLRLPKDVMQKESAKLKEFLQRKFVLCGRTFIPFHAKDRGLYMVEINEDFDRKPQDEFGDQYRISFADFINWHNPPEYNHKQALSKYVTRFALGLSTSVPVLEFEEKNMFYIDDIYGNEYRGGKASADETMTDGCGLINQAALVAINSILNKSSLPVAIQGRIAGAKGVWLLHPTDNSSEYKIWVRESQNKIKHPSLHRSHRIFEIVASSHPSGPVAVSQQSIVNLSYNGVPDGILMSYLEKGLTETIEPLVKWDHPKAHLNLWFAINVAGNVSKGRLGRLTAGISRALGLTRRTWNEDEDDEEEDIIDFDEDKSTDTGRNEYSGAPLGLHESALELVQSGFHPSTSKNLREKIKCIIEQAIKTYVEKYRVPLRESLDAFVVPDPLGVLEEGEIYYRSSQSIPNPQTQRTFDVVTGDVILGRYPIRVASDLQKVKVVNRPELYPWPDVIIASTKGSRSLASLLSGGDMDGDELFMIRELEIVEPFQNKPFVAGPPDLLEKNFQKHVETVGNFCERVKSQLSTESQVALQAALLLSLNEDRKGLYSLFHDSAIEKLGYNSPEAIRLAYIPELYPWPDVIIASTKGSRSLASLLSGGDMDGDELFMIRELEIVEPFQNKPFVAGPPDLLEKNFQKHVETVGNFCERVKSQLSTESQVALQAALLLSLNEDRKGLYSLFHDSAIEKFGYNSPEAIRLAYMFNTLLDASKSGLILADGIFEQDRKKKKPANPSTNPSSDAFILTKLQERAIKKGDELLKQFANVAEACSEKRDPHLIQSYEEASDFANRMCMEAEITTLFRDDLTKIRDHVEKVHEEWSREASKAKSKLKAKSKSKKGSSGSSEVNIYKKAAMLFASPVEGIMATRHVQEICVSYAYYRYPNSAFAFQVAFRVLCEMKAKATRGGMAPCITEIDEMKMIPASCIRAVEKSYAD